MGILLQNHHSGVFCCCCFLNECEKHLCDKNNQHGAATHDGHTFHPPTNRKKKSNEKSSQFFFANQQTVTQIMSISDIAFPPIIAPCIQGCTYLSEMTINMQARLLRRNNISKTHFHIFIKNQDEIMQQCTVQPTITAQTTNILS